MPESSKRVRKIAVGALAVIFGVPALLICYFFFTTKAVVAVSDQSGHKMANSDARMFRIETSDFRMDAPWHIYYESERERPVIHLFGEDHRTERLETNPDWGWIEISKTGNFRVKAMSNKKLRLAVMKDRRPVFFIRNWQEVGGQGMTVRGSSD